MAIDIDQSFYNTGTASVTNGGTVVTGQGTQWVSSIRANDIFGTHKGDGVRILSVESNTSLTLAYPWTGETQSTAPYEVQFTPYDTGYYPAVRQLLQTMASGNIEAFAALTGSPDTIPIFTGPGAMDLLPISSLATPSDLEEIREEITTLSSNLDDKVSKTETNDQSIVSKLSAPYILSQYRGLKISEFLTSNGAWNEDQTTQTQQALNALISEIRYTSLDLEGRNILISSPLTMGTNEIGWPNKSICNGFLYASSTFPVGGYLFDLKDNPSISNFKFLNVVLNGRARAGWIRAPKKYKYFTMESCSLSSAGGSGGTSPGILGRKVGFYDPDIPSGGSHELGFYSCYLDSNQYTGTKDQIAIYTRNPDVNINNCLGQYFKDFFVGTSGSYQFNDNHIWSPADGSTACSMVRLLDCTTIAGLQMTGNYIDGVQIVLGNELNPTSTISGVSITGNLFLYGPGLPADMPFVLLKPQNTNTGVMAIDMIGNVYDTNNTTNAFQNIGVDTSTGSINPAGIRRVRLDDLAYSEYLLGKVYRSRVNYNASFTSSDGGYRNISFQNQIPTFARLQRVISAQYMRPDGSGPLVFAVPTIQNSSRDVGVVLSNGSTVQSVSGRVEIIADINVENYQ